MTLLLGMLLAGPAGAQELTLSGPAQPPPDVYIIQPGDTLWDIASRFLGNPYYWPRLWSINSYITNPHWIYPGNRIVFTPGTLLEPPSITVEEGAPAPAAGGYQVASFAFEPVVYACGPDVRFDDEIPTARYVTPGLLAEEDDLTFLGRVEGARSGMTFLGTGDLLYLRLDDPDAVSCGDVFSIVRRGPKVRHPEERLSYGRLWKVVAEARVLHKDPDNGTVTARVRRMYDALKRGDRVAPLTPVMVELPVHAPRGDVEARVVARLGQDVNEIAGTGETVFIDRGSEDGLRVGDSLYLVERSDPRLTEGDWDEDLPMSVTGRVVLTRVEDFTSTGIVVNAGGPVRIGAHLVASLD